MLIDPETSVPLETTSVTTKGSARSKATRLTYLPASPASPVNKIV
jgi:hypothetical protein